MSDTAALEALLRAGLDPVEHVEVVDESGGCGAKFVITVVSPVFEGVGLLDRHRKVQAVLAEPLKSIHAVTLKTMTPAQWAAKKAQ